MPLLVRRLGFLPRRNGLRWRSHHPGVFHSLWWPRPIPSNILNTLRLAASKTPRDSEFPNFITRCRESLAGL